MPFGLKNAPGHFQSFVNQIFGDMIDRGLLVFIDDLLIYGKSRDEHDKLLIEVFHRLKLNHLKANPKKCLFLVQSVEFLGHVLCEKGIKMSPSKLASILTWQYPTNVKELQSFLGLANYYRTFIPNYSATALPLHSLTRKGSVFSFDATCKTAFDLLKERFASDVVLVSPDPNEQLFIVCDASDFALGSVIQQKDPTTGHLRPIAFHSRNFTPSEINYEIYDKELLAIIDSLATWRYLCIGSPHPIIIFTDHNNLRYFMSSKRLNRRQARWSLFLADFNFELHVRPGPTQLVADPLSRQRKYQPTKGDAVSVVNEQVLLGFNRFPKIPVSASICVVDHAPIPPLSTSATICTLETSQSNLSDECSGSDTS